MPRWGKFAGLRAAGTCFHVSMGPLGGSRGPFKFAGGQRREAPTAVRAPGHGVMRAASCWLGLGGSAPARCWCCAPSPNIFYVLITSHVGDSCSFSFLSKCLLPFSLWFLKLPTSGSRSCKIDSHLLDQSIPLISKSNPAKVCAKH